VARKRVRELRGRPKESDSVKHVRLGRSERRLRQVGLRHVSEMTVVNVEFVGLQSVAKRVS
jgi:hypothetical protein